MIDFISVDKAGRIVIPKLFRDRYNISAGDEFELSDTGEELRLRPRRIYAPMEERPNGWIVFTDPVPDSFDAVAEIDAVRSQRHRDLL